MGNDTRTNGVFLVQRLTAVSKMQIRHIGGTAEETQVDVTA